MNERQRIEEGKTCPVCGGIHWGSLYCPYDGKAEPVPALRPTPDAQPGLVDTRGWNVMRESGDAQPKELELLNEFIGYISVEYGWPQERWENCQKLAQRFLDAPTPQPPQDKEPGT